MYYHGLGVEKDWHAARALYKKVAPSHHNARLLLEELEAEMKKNGMKIERKSPESNDMLKHFEEFSNVLNSFYFPIKFTNNVQRVTRRCLKTHENTYCHGNRNSNAIRSNLTYKDV